MAKGFPGLEMRPPLTKAIEVASTSERFTVKIRNRTEINPSRIHVYLVLGCLLELVMRVVDTMEEKLSLTTTL